MFNKGKDSGASRSSSTVSDAVPETPATTNRRTMSKSSNAPSILSTDLVINGTVMSEGEIQLDGQIEGDVRAGSLTVGEKASVKGEVIADHVTIRGRVLGSVRGRQVTLMSTARIEGDITHAALSVESGAFFEGNCRHASDPLAGSGDSASASSSSSSVSVSSARPADASKPASSSTPTFGSTAATSSS